MRADESVKKVFRAVCPMEFYCIDIQKKTAGANLCRYLRCPWRINLQAEKSMVFDMKVIGITGGIGSGKSEVLAYLREHTRCRVIIADRLAHELEEPEGVCYGRIVALLGREILGADGRIDKAKMAGKIFGSAKLLAQVNAIVHPAVKEEIMAAIEAERAAGRVDYLFIEAALLIEEGYGQIVDEMWYIHVDEQTRRERLKRSRGYSDGKIDSIIKEQLAEAEFYRHCSTVIDNSGTLQSTFGQIDQKLGEDLCQKA